MKKLYFLWICIFVLTLNSCKKDNKPTLQQYLVETRENPNFHSLDISTSMLNSYISLADKETQESIKSVQKINLIGLQSKGNKVEYDKEKARLDAVMSESTKYKPLIKVKKQGVKLNLYYQGTPENISELVIYAHAEEYGLGLARLTGKGIKTDKIIKLIKKTEVPQEILDGIKSKKLNIEPIW